MKDPALAIRSAYLTSLNGSITLNAANVPVYDRVPNNATEPYVVIADQTETGDSQKGQCYGVDTTILLDIVTRFKSGGGKRDADIISNQILQKVTLNYPDTLPEFKIYHITLENANYLESIEDTSYVVRKLLRLRNFVQQFN